MLFAMLLHVGELGTSRYTHTLSTKYRRLAAGLTSPYSAPEDTRSVHAIRTGYTAYGPRVPPYAYTNEASNSIVANAVIIIVVFRLANARIAVTLVEGGTRAEDGVAGVSA